MNKTKTEVNDENRIEYIMDYETGNLSDIQTLHLFSNLVETGLAWGLQGHYGRTANHLIEAGYMDTKGVLNTELIESNINN
tara:strand:+ start:1110 stop:1352 length:243 start_codon:yes stop_codon:yes gene_type:complete